MAGERPPRPVDPRQNQWLQDPVWNVITAGWHHEPEQRCELPVVYRVFLTSSHQNVESGELSAQNNRSFI